MLSRSPPRSDNPLLDVETKTFAPDLRVGDRLSFALRANATRTWRTPEGETKRADVVMHALRLEPKDARGAARPKAIVDAGRAWLEKEAAKAGFRVVSRDGEPALAIDGYEQWRFPGLGAKGRISTLDFQGEIEVVDPELFLRCLSQGFGRAKAFGCGLMLIRRG